MKPGIRVDTLAAYVIMSAFSPFLLLLLLSRHIARMKSMSYQFIFVIIHVVTSSHYICLISANCAMPDPIANTITTLPNQTLDTGSYITWECSDGYMMDGLTNTAVWVCLEDGSWLGHTPICTAIECPSPPIAAYSELDPVLADTNIVNQTISYTCSSSEYTLLGRNLNRCLQDGTWENDPPVCQRDCDDTADLLQRYSNLTCYRQRDGDNWKDSLDICNANGELLATVKDAKTQTFLVEFIGDQIGNSVWIGAMDGRNWIWRHSGKYIERFFWQIPFPSANRQDCIELSYQDRSFSWSPRSKQSENGLLCQYDRSCQSVGLSQSDMVLEYMGTCFQFLDVSKNCEVGAEECNGRGGFLAEIIDESANAVLLDRALYLRDEGVNTAWWIGGYDENVGQSWYWSDKTRMNYEAWYEGEPNINDEDCLEMGKYLQYQWNDHYCSERKRTLCQIGIPACGDPGEPLHGNRLPDDRTTYSVDATLHFTCQEGYTLSGESVLRCMTNGTWNHQRPSCEAVECGNFPQGVALASIMIQRSVYRDIAVYTCQDGYIPDNEPISFCQHTGTWIIPNFTCTESNSAGGFPRSISTVVGSAVGAILGTVMVIVLIIIFYKRRSNDSATSKSKGKESDSSPQYENPVFDQSQTDAHTNQDLNTITHTNLNRNTDDQSYDDTANPHTYQEPDQEANYEEVNDAKERDQEANYEEVNDAKERDYVNNTMIKQNKVLLG